MKEKRIFFLSLLLLVCFPLISPLTMPTAKAEGWVSHYTNSGVLSIDYDTDGYMMDQELVSTQIPTDELPISSSEYDFVKIEISYQVAITFSYGNTPQLTFYISDEASLMTSSFFFAEMSAVGNHEAELLTDETTIHLMWSLYVYNDPSYGHVSIDYEYTIYHWDYSDDIQAANAAGTTSGMVTGAIIGVIVGLAVGIIAVMLFYRRK